MENTFVSPYRLTPISELKRERESQITTLINNLKYNDVKKDDVFLKTTNRIKKSILIEQVVFGDPKFIDHEFEDVPLSMQQQLIGGISKNHYYHQIDFPFSGDSDLFSCQPESFTYSSSDRGLIQPFSNILTVYVDLPELNPERAIREARNLLSMTFQFVNGNNSSIQSWSIVVGQRIDELLKQKREELNRILGVK